MPEQNIVDEAIDQGRGFGTSSRTPKRLQVVAREDNRCSTMFKGLSAFLKTIIFLDPLRTARNSQYLTNACLFAFNQRMYYYYLKQNSRIASTFLILQTQCMRPQLRCVAVGVNKSPLPKRDAQIAFVSNLFWHVNILFHGLLAH